MPRAKPQPKRPLWPLVVLVLGLAMFGGPVLQLAALFLGFPGLAMASGDD